MALEIKLIISTKLTMNLHQFNFLNRVKLV